MEQTRESDGAGVDICEPQKIAPLSVGSYTVHKLSEGSDIERSVGRMLGGIEGKEVHWTSAVDEHS